MPNFSLQNSMLDTKEVTQLIEGYYAAIEKKPTSLKLSRVLFITANPLLSSVASTGIISFKNNYSMRLQSVDFQVVSSRNTRDHKVNEDQIQLVEKMGRFFNTVSLQIISSEHLETL